jgi:hypothetical protein
MRYRTIHAAVYQQRKGSRGAPGNTRIAHFGR